MDMLSESGVGVDVLAMARCALQCQRYTLSHPFDIFLVTLYHVVKSPVLLASLLFAGRCCGPRG